MGVNGNTFLVRSRRRSLTERVEILCIMKEQFWLSTGPLGERGGQAWTCSERGRCEKKLGTSQDAWMSKEECWTTRIFCEDEAQYPILVVCQAVMKHSFPTVTYLSRIATCSCLVQVVLWGIKTKEIEMWSMLRSLCTEKSHSGKLEWEETMSYEARDIFPGLPTLCGRGLKAVSKKWYRGVTRRLDDCGLPKLQMFGLQK